MILCIRCILYPRAKLFITSGGKQQAAAIVTEKVDELCELVPALNREINKDRGKGTQFQKDYVKVLWKSKSYFDNIVARESSRGKRRHGGLVEECVGVDGKILNEVIIPTMNIDRQCADGTFQEDETLNKSQIFVTTAGYKNTYPYDKLIQILVRSVLEPDKAIILGGTWRVPVLVGLQNKSFISDLKRDGTFNETSFDREYRRFVLFKLLRIAERPLRSVNYNIRMK